MDALVYCDAASDSQLLVHSDIRGPMTCLFTGKLHTSPF